MQYLQYLQSLLIVVRPDGGAQRVHGAARLDEVRHARARLALRHQPRAPRALQRRHQRGARLPVKWYPFTTFTYKTYATLA